MFISEIDNEIEAVECMIKTALQRAISMCESVMRGGYEKPTEEQLKKLGRLSRMYNEMFNPP